MLATLHHSTPCGRVTMPCDEWLAPALTHPSEAGFPVDDRFQADRDEADEARIDVPCLLRQAGDVFPTSLEDLVLDQAVERLHQVLAPPGEAGSDPPSPSSSRVDGDDRFRPRLLHGLPIRRGVVARIGHDAVGMKAVDQGGKEGRVVAVARRHHRADREAVLVDGGVEFEAQEGPSGGVAPPGLRIPLVLEGRGVHHEEAAGEGVLEEAGQLLEVRLEEGLVASPPPADGGPVGDPAEPEAPDHVVVLREVADEAFIRLVHEEPHKLKGIYENTLRTTR
jgi:hypothetical protein